jgi:hypothetical protein
MKGKLILLVSLIVLVSGCAGTGFNKKCTLMPDSIGLETDLDSQDRLNSKVVEMRATWNLK